MVLSDGENRNLDIRVSGIHTDKKAGYYFAVGTRKGWVELRVTPSGLIRFHGLHKGTHPYFTLKEDE